jgi:hypothetical protein
MSIFTARSRESGDPEIQLMARWVPAFAGTSGRAGMAIRPIPFGSSSEIDLTLLAGN